ncbi:MAG: zinc ribbon domain-containing protein [Planctomycetota bacterium]|jgi:hypothetical protein
MRQNPRTLFGQIALDLCYLTEDELEQLITVQRRTEGDAPLAMLAVRSGMLTQDQVDDILHVQQDRRRALAKYASGKEEETAFGRLAIELGMADRQSIDYALSQFVRRRKEGETARLGQVCIEMGILSADQVKELLKEQRKNILVCISCGTQYNVRNLAPGQKMRCKKCSSLLQGMEDPSSVEVDPIELTAGPPLQPIGGASGSHRQMLRRGDGTSIPRVFDPSARLFGGLADLEDLRHRISRVRTRFKVQPAAATATLPHPSEEEDIIPLTPSKTDQFGSPGGLGKFALHGTARAPSEYDQFITALEEEAAATENSGMIFTAALNRALDGFPGPQTQERRSGFDKTETQEIHYPREGAEHDSEEIVQLHASSEMADEIESFFTEAGPDVVELSPRDGSGHSDIDSYDTAELQEHELPDSEVYERAALIAAEKIPATPPGGILHYQPSQPSQVGGGMPIEPGPQIWRTPPGKINWILDHWVKVAIGLAAAGLLGLVGWILYIVIF